MAVTADVPGSATRVAAEQVEDPLRHRPFALLARGAEPFVGQVFGRACTQGLPDRRSMHSFVGVPMKLTAGEAGGRGRADVAVSIRTYDEGCLAAR
jgi:hypothetical protein